jgi:phage-related protein
MDGAHSILGMLAEKVGNTIYVLHCFEKETRKTDRRDIEIVGQRLRLVRQRLQEQRTHEKRSEK